MMLPHEIWFREIAPFLTEGVFLMANKEIYNTYIKNTSEELDEGLKFYRLHMEHQSIHRRHVALFKVRMYDIRMRILALKKTEIEPVLDRISQLKKSCESMSRLAISIIREETPRLGEHVMPHGSVRHFLCMLSSVDCISGELIEAKYPQLRDDFLVAIGK